MALGSTQSLTEMSTRLFPGGKGGRCVRLTTLPPSCAVVMKSENFNFLEPSGPLQACNGTALPFYLYFRIQDNSSGQPYETTWCKSPSRSNHAQPQDLQLAEPITLAYEKTFNERKQSSELKIFSSMSWHTWRLRCLLTPQLTTQTIWKIRHATLTPLNAHRGS